MSENRKNRATIIQEIEQYDDFRKLVLNRDRLLDDIRLDYTNGQVIDLSNTPTETLYELQTKTVVWGEYLADLFSRVKSAITREEIRLNNIESSSMAAKTEVKMSVSEKKAFSRTSPEYVLSAQRIGSLSAYSEYLTGLRSMVDKHHYTIKSRIDSVQHSEQKYYSQR